MLDEAMRSGLGVAINEANWVGFALDPATRTAQVTLLVPRLPANALAEVQLLLHGVTRLAVSLRGGNWNDPAAPVEPLRLSDLPAAVASFGGQPIYGWDFFAAPDVDQEAWLARPSLDWRAAASAVGHPLRLFQEGVGRHLDLCVWFDSLDVLDGRGLRVPVAKFIADGLAWWRGFREGTARAEALGLHNLRLDAAG